VITVHRKVLTLGAGDFDVPPEAIGQIELPTPFAPNNHAFQQTVARRLQHARLEHRNGGDQRGGPSDEVVEARRAVSEHPVDRCPDRDAHLRALVQLERARSEITELRRSVKGRTESLARRFDRVLRVLEAWGYLDGWALTEKGDRLGRIYHECDLLITEALDTGVLDGLDPAALAGLVSTFTYERRAPGPPPTPWFPSGKARQRFTTLEKLARELNADEKEAGLPMTRAPDPGFVSLAHAWAAGEALDDVLEDEDLAGGDFVRNVKQLIDLLRQAADAAPAQETARAAREAADALFRGVIAASSVVSVE
jgi:ATP-dependent RNA helicase HelY